MELKPCPFCGDEARLQKSYNGGDIEWQIICNSCGANIPSQYEEQQAERNWNRRTYED